MDRSYMSMAVFDNSPQPFCVIRVELDREGKPEDWTFLYCNKALAELEGYPEETLVGRRFFDLFPGGDKKWLQPYYEAAYENRVSSFASRSEEVGKYLYVECFPLDGQGLCGCLLRSTTQQMEYRRELKSISSAANLLHAAITTGLWRIEYNEKGERTQCVWSEAFCKLLGYSSAAEFPEFLDAWVEKIHPEERQAVLEAYNRAVYDYSGTERYDVEYRMRNRQGEYHWFRDTAHISRRADGSPIAADGIIVLTDEKHQSEEKLRKALHDAEEAGRASREKAAILRRTEAYNRHLLESAACGIVAYTLPGHKNLYMNAAALRSMGFRSLEEAESCLGQRLREATYSDPKALQKLTKLRSADGALDYEVRVPNQSGYVSTLLVHSQVVTNPQGEHIAYTSFLDVTENKQLQTVNETLENQSRIITGLSKEYTSVWYVTDNGQSCVKFQDSELDGVARDFQAFSDREGDYASGIRQYIDHYVCEDNREEVARKLRYEVVQQQIREKAVYSVVCKREYQGRTAYFQINFTLAGDGQNTDFVMGFKDVSDVVHGELQKNEALAAALASAEHANKAKTQFLNNMSHDIRTPMNAIIGFTSLACSHIENTNQVKEYLGKIATSSEHLLSLINDILDMSRIESGKVKIDEKPLHLPELMHDIRTIIQPSVVSKQLDFLLDTVDVVDEDVVADRMRLTQILLNILSNAVKYNRIGGMIALRIRQEKTAPRGFATYHFVVKDTGIGMSEEFQSHIFESFTREETSTVSGIQGTGLGMAITKKNVEMMGGTIRISSTEGVGSEFDVCLTFRLDGEKKHDEKIESLQGLRVLVADDDTDTCLNAAKMLSEIGMRPEWTTSGKEAVIRTKLALEMGDEFYAYIIDWLMPDMNGIETVRRIRRLIGDRSPIIILTAYDWSDVEEEARQAGVTAFCEKPLFLSEVRRILTKPVPEKEPHIVSLADCKGKKILLTEDNVLNQEIAQTILEDAGFLVEIAGDGRIAVEKMAAAKPGQYDLILMDIQMPQMNGYEATKRIRAMTSPYCKQIPIIAMTANAFEEDKALALQAGMNDYLAKPIQIDQMLKVISRVLKD